MVANDLDTETASLNVGSIFLTSLQCVKQLGEAISTRTNPRSICLVV